MFRFARMAPRFQSRNPLPNSSLGKTKHSHKNSENSLSEFQLVPNFVPKIVEKFLFIYSSSSESWLWEPQTIVISFFSISNTIIVLFRAEYKMTLADLVMGFWASDVFSQVMSLTK